MNKHLHIIATTPETVVPLQISATKSKDTVLISIVGHIADWSDASSRQVRKDINAFVASGITKAEVYVNTKGGDVFEAQEITNLLKDSFKEVKVRVGALAASAGTYITSTFHTTAKKNTQFMIHKPSAMLSGNEDKIKRDLKALKNMTSEYRSLYVAKTGMPESDIDALWGKGDHWMNAQEALDAGFIDEIDEGDAKIDATSVLMLTACGAPEIPEITAQSHETPKTTIDMDMKILAAKLGLPSNATEAQVNAALDAQKAKAETADSLQSQLDDQAEQNQAERIKALLDQAETDKKINAKTRANYEALAKTDFPQVEAIIKEMQPLEKIEVNARAKGNAGDEGTTGISAEHKDFTYGDFQEKAPEAFAKLPEETQEKLIEAHYKE